MIKNECNEIQIFKNESFGEVRVTEVNGEPWFVGKDVATILGYAKPTDAIIDHVDSDDCKVLSYKAFAKTEKASLWQGNDFSDKTLINESGVYSLILASKLPAAKQFKRWVTSEVLPSIRKTGGYIMPKTFAQALRLAAEQQEQIEAQQALLDAQKPKVEYFDALVDRNLLTNFRDTAKELGIGQADFIKKLLTSKYVYRDAKNKLKPYAQFAKTLFELKEFKSNNNKHTDLQTLITPRGRETFRLLFAARE